jgi:DNA modification methylase
MSVQILIGDVRDVLRTLPDAYFDCVVTSPPYWGLRDYGVPGQIGLEPSLSEHIGVMVSVFREVRRVLKPHGTLWLNYGDCYAASVNGNSAESKRAAGTDDRAFRDKPFSTVGGVLKPKDLCMIPNRLAIALQEDGWWVRSEIVWHKPNPMPESVYDRPTQAHEKIWLLTKSEEYFYNHEAIREPVTGGAHARARQEGRDTGVGWGRLDKLDPEQGDRGRNRVKTPGANSRQNVDRVPRSRKPGVTPKSVDDSNRRVKAKESWHASTTQLVDTRSARNVWTIAPKAFREAHFATFPPALAERCIKAGVPLDTCALCGHVEMCGGLCTIGGRVPGRVLDPFGGAGTVGLVANQLGLDATLIELNPEYAAIAERRIFGNASQPKGASHDSKTAKAETRHAEAGGGASSAMLDMRQAHSRRGSVDDQGRGELLPFPQHTGV